jgi:hypothetical protein
MGRVNPWTKFCANDTRVLQFTSKILARVEELDDRYTYQLGSPNYEW